MAGEGPLMKDLVEIADHDFHNVNITSIIVIFVIMILVFKICIDSGDFNLCD